MAPMADSVGLSVLIGLISLAVTCVLYWGFDTHQLLEHMFKRIKVPFKHLSIIMLIMNLLPFSVTAVVVIYSFKGLYRSAISEYVEFNNKQTMDTAKTQAAAGYIKDLESLRRVALNRLYFSPAVTNDQKKLYEAALQNATTMADIAEISTKY